jgi:integrase/recombinase XerC
VTQVPQGWALWWSRGIAYVRWRQGSKRHTVSTGERDATKAAEKAAQIYARSIAGQWKPTPKLGGHVQPLSKLIDPWLEDFSAGRFGGTSNLYRLHWTTHLAPHFENDISKITTATILDYQRSRLRVVSRETVIKELNSLRSFLRWLAEHEIIADARVPPLPRGLLGTTAQPRKRTELSIEQVHALLTALPDRTPARKKGVEVWVQPYFVVLFETGLRPATVQTLSVPEHWRKGRGELEIDPRLDKARYGRKVPLTGPAVAALERAAPPSGVVFGRHDLRAVLESTCRKTGLPRVTPYDLRHARATHLLEASGDLPGVAFLLGHRRVTTTNLYARPNRRAGESVLARWTRGQKAKGLPGSIREAYYGQNSVRRGGLEPPRCYPLAPQASASAIPPPSRGGKSRGCELRPSAWEAETKTTSIVVKEFLASG